MLVRIVKENIIIPDLGGSGSYFMEIAFPGLSTLMSDRRPGGFMEITVVQIS